MHLLAEGTDFLDERLHRSRDLLVFHIAEPVELLDLVCSTTWSSKKFDDQRQVAGQKEVTYS